MNKFEEEVKSKKQDLSNFTLYTSLEPCPMCLSRLITSGIGRVVYASKDEEGGMVSRISGLPPIWKELAKSQVFEQANISKELERIAKKIFTYNVNKLDNDLKI